MLEGAGSYWNLLEYAVRAYLVGPFGGTFRAKGRASGGIEKREKMRE